MTSVDVLRNVVKDVDALNWFKGIYEGCPPVFLRQVKFTLIRDAIHAKHFKNLEVHCKNKLIIARQMQHETERNYSPNPNFKPERISMAQEEALADFMDILHRLSTGVDGIDSLRGAMKEVDVLNWFEEIYKKCPLLFRGKVSFTTIHNAIHTENFHDLEEHCKEMIISAKKLQQETESMYPNVNHEQISMAQKEALANFMDILRRLSTNNRGITRFPWDEDA
jgi:Fe-S-cluster formation regulator IscX/YfhJ